MWPPLWGHYYWRVIHNSTLLYCKTPQEWEEIEKSKDEQNSWLMKVFEGSECFPDEALSALKYMISKLPCPSCKMHANRYINDQDHLLEDVKFGSDAFMYFVDFHNEINRRLKKVEFNVTQVLQSINLDVISNGKTSNNIVDLMKRLPTTYDFCYFVPLIFTSLVGHSSKTVTSRWSDENFSSFVEFVNNYRFLMPFNPSPEIWNVSLEKAKKFDNIPIVLVTYVYNRVSPNFGGVPFKDAEALLVKFRSLFGEESTEAMKRSHSMRLEDHRILNDYIRLGTTTGALVANRASGNVSIDTVFAVVVAVLILGIITLVILLVKHPKDKNNNVKIV